MDELHDGRRLPMDEEERCPKCDGTGSYLSHDLDGFVIDQVCPDCRGTGYKLPECPRCDGLGYLIDKKKYSFISKNLKVFDTFVPCPDCHGTGYQQPEDDEIPY
jgi:DnaJ-class molecular chaperone